jgi:thioredoxin-dependent peroxiredoxin
MRGRDGRPVAKLKVGQQAPDFVLPGTGDKIYRLADYSDRGVILAFYPGDFTPVCTKQFCSYRDDGDRIESLGVPMLGVSPQSVSSHQRFAEKNALRVPLLADTDKKVAKAYGVVGPGGMIRRSVFLIDVEGVVRYRHIALLGLTFRDVDDLEQAVAVLG